MSIAVSFSELLGETLVKITPTDLVKGPDSIMFETASGKLFHMFHRQSCCEVVEIEDITGNLSDLIGSPILLAEESSKGEGTGLYGPQKTYQSSTWTFYNIATAKGHVTIRWTGTSNGYYSEGADFERLH